LAVSRDTQEILGHYVGTRELESFNQLYDKIAHIPTEKYASDYWRAYGWLPESKHLWGKAHTYTVERTNRRLRHYLSRLIRKTYCFSKSKEMLDMTLTLFRYRNSFMSISF